MLRLLVTLALIVAIVMATKDGSRFMQSREARLLKEETLEDFTFNEPIESNCEAITQQFCSSAELAYLKKWYGMKGPALEREMKRIKDAATAAMGPVAVPLKYTSRKARLLRQLVKKFKMDRLRKLKPRKQKIEL
jgi:hypothetical protein